MRRRFDIDDQLLAEAQASSGSSTNQETVERALRLMVKLARQTDVRRLRGQLIWDGNLPESRRDEI